MATLSDEAKAEIAAAIAIVREDKHFKMLSEIHGRGNPPADPPKNDPPADPPKPTDPANPPVDPPPPTPPADPEPKKRRGVWWDSSLFAEESEQK